MVFAEPLTLMFLSIAVAALVAIGAVLFLGRSGLVFRIPADQVPVDPRSVFLFDGTDLVDASPSAEERLARAPQAETDWTRLITALSGDFPRLTVALDGLDSGSTISLRSIDGTAQLYAEIIDGRTRITVNDLSGGPDEVRLESVAFRAILRELEVHRSMSENLPIPLWRQSADGDVTWANPAYVARSNAASPGSPEDAWPPRPIFSATDLADLREDAGPRRLMLRGSSHAKPSWFECRATDLGGETLYSAFNVDGTVLAEQQLREFMQTLTKTFSHLTTGLAIFDRSRRLALFNPALTDLTGLPADFLTARPALYTFLDRLRDRRMIPEPKDYGSWRRQMSELEAAASDGSYSETWSLPDNRTYRITGRPHPGGAVAFLIEDISAEMSLTRRFRSELELGQAVIDALDEAIIVFAPSGSLSMVNQAYQDMWSVNIGDTVDVPTVTEISRTWMSRTKATPIWGDIRDFVLHERERTIWEDEVAMPDGVILGCRIMPLTGGSTMVSFKVVQPAELMQPRLQASG